MLAEILMVIGIIAVLLGILLPVISNAREAARQTRCAANLAQVGRLAFAYAAENRGWVLRDATSSFNSELWTTVCRPFVEMLDWRFRGLSDRELMLASAELAFLKCPSHPKPEIPSTYVVNAFVFDESEQQFGAEIAGPTQLSAIRRPSNVAFVFDAEWPFWIWIDDERFRDEHFALWVGILSAWHPNHIGRPPPYLGIFAPPKVADKRHHGSSLNILNFDGSVRKIERAQLGTADLDDGVRSRAYAQRIKAQQ